MNTYTKIFITIFFLSPMSVFAETAIVNIDTYGEEINALEARLVLPESMQVKRIGAGNTAILMWVTEPHQEGQEITFAGITPGGFSGPQSLFILYGTFYPKDLENVKFENVRALKNDGSGEQVPVVFSLVMDSFRADNDSPEDFTPTIASDTNVFDGKFFLVFATQDKGSGIARYEVREGYFGSWRVAESPHLLAHQKLNRNVYVMAIDYAGNERVVVVRAVHSTWQYVWGLFAILIVLVVVTLLAIRNKRQVT